MRPGQGVLRGLLTRSNLPISAVAEEVGISDYNYFTKVFRAAVGMTPRAFRKENEGGTDTIS